MKSIVVLLALFCLCQGRGGGCPKGWIRFRDGDRCYYISGNVDTFDGANKYCKSKKSHLAPALTCDANIYLVNLLAAYRAKCPRGKRCDKFWIGIQNISDNGWRTGNDLLVERERPCQQWGTGFPRGNGTCGIMSLRGTWKRGVWKNVNCTNRYKYVCICCPNDFDYVPEVNECFYLNLNKTTWRAAQRKCSKMKKGAHLMTIHDSTKQKAVVNYMKLQLTRKESEICFMVGWLDPGRIIWLGGQTEIGDVCGTPYVWKQLKAPDTPFTYSNWLPGLPNCDSNENCAILTTSPKYKFRWEDVSCWYDVCSVCEF